MDFREPTTHQPQEPMRPIPPPPKTKRGGRGKGLLKLLLVLLLIAGAGAGAYYWRDKEAKDDASQQSGQTSQLQQQISKLESDLKEAEDKASAEAAAKAGPSADTLKKVQDAVKAGKYADIQNLMASKVFIIIAASEGLGSRTPAQAVADLKYLDSGTDPWNFALATAVIDGYQDGDYAQYFPVGALVGKSANNYVVSFVFSNSGKISVIFMAANADLL